MEIEGEKDPRKDGWKLETIESDMMIYVRVWDVNDRDNHLYRTMVADPI